MTRRAGLSFGSPVLQSAGLGLSPDPSNSFEPNQVRLGPASLNPSQPSPLDVPSAEEVGANLRSFAGSMLPQPLQNRASQVSPRVWFSQSTGRMSVGDFTFNENNASDALRSREILASLQQDTPPPQDADDWRALDPQEYAAYLDEIENPGLARIAGESFQTGMRGMGEIYNAALVWAGIDREGALRRIDEIQQGHYRDAPFQRTDVSQVEDFSDAVEFGIAAMAQTGPWIIETALTAAVGAAVGSATGGPGPGTLGGAVGTLAAREGVKRAMRVTAGHFAAARTRGLAGQEAFAFASQAAARAGEETLFNQGARAFRALGPQFGAAAGVTAGNVATGIGDTYNEMLSNGVDPDDPGARERAALYGLAYAGADTATDLLLGAGVTGRLPGLRNPLARIPATAAGGAVAEGASEATQEALITHAAAEQTDQEWWTPETQSRLVNAAAAGAVPGFAGGAIAGVRTPGQYDTPDTPVATPPAPSSPAPVGPSQPVQPAGPAPVTVGPEQVPVYGVAGEPINAIDPEEIARRGGLRMHGQGPTPNIATYGPGGIPLSEASTAQIIPTEPAQQQELPLDAPAQPNRGITPELEALYAAIRDNQPLAPEQQEHLVRLQNTPREQLSPPEQFVLQTAYPQSTDKTWTSQPMRRAGPLSPRQQEPQQGRLDLGDTPNNVPGSTARNKLTRPRGTYTQQDAPLLNVPQELVDTVDRLVKRGETRTTAEDTLMRAYYDGGLEAARQAWPEFQRRRAMEVERAGRKASERAERLRRGENSAPAASLRRVLNRLDETYAPENDTPRDQVRVAISKQGQVLSIRDAKNEAVTAWGRTFEAQEGRDYVIGEEQNSARVVRKSIADQSYEPAEGGVRKKAGVVYGYYVLDKNATIQTLEGPQEANAGDYVMIGVDGEQWPVDPKKFEAQYAPQVTRPLASDQQSGTPRQAQVDKAKALRKGNQDGVQEQTAREIPPREQTGSSQADGTAEPAEQQAAPEDKGQAEQEQASAVDQRPEVLALLDELKKLPRGKAGTKLGGLISGRRNKLAVNKPSEWKDGELEWVKEQLNKDTDPEKTVSFKIRRKKPPLTQPPGNRLGMFDLFSPRGWKQTPRQVGVVGRHHIGPEAIAQEILQERAQPVRLKDVVETFAVGAGNSRTIVIDDLGKLWVLPTNASRSWTDFFTDRTKSGERPENGVLLNATKTVEVNASGSAWVTVRIPETMTPKARNSVRALIKQMREAGAKSMRVEQYPLDGEPVMLRDSDEIDAALSGENSGRGAFRLGEDDGSTSTPSTVEEVRTTAEAALSKFAVKPILTVTRNGKYLQGDKPVSETGTDLSVRGKRISPEDGVNPILYAQMKAAYHGSDKDFEENIANAEGYSFLTDDGKPHVVLFADNLHGEQHTKFVLFHETIGHIGMQAFMRSDGRYGLDPETAKLPKTLSGLNKAVSIENLLAWVYQESPQVRAHVAIQTRGKNPEGSKNFAHWIEEAVADLAASIEVSIYKRFQFHVKNFLNSIGVKFDDDLTRYVVSRLRRYVRYGDKRTGRTFDAKKLFVNNSGRFRTVDDPAGLNELAQTASGMQDLRAGISNRSGIVYAMREQAAKAGDFWTGVLETFRTQDDAIYKSAGVQAVLRDVFAATHEDKMSAVNRYQQNMKLSQSLEPKPEERQEANDLLNYASLYNHDKFTYDDADKYPLLVITPEGRREINNAKLTELRKVSILTPEQFNAGLEWRTAEGEAVAGTYKPKNTITEDSVSYKIYLEHMNARFDVEIDKLKSYFEEQGGLDDAGVQSFLRSYARGKYDAADVAWFKRVQREYATLYFEKATLKDGVIELDKEATQNAENFLEETLKALHSEEKRKDWTDKTRTARTRKAKDADGNDVMEEEYAAQFRDQARFADIISGMGHVKRLGITKEQQVRMLVTFQSLVSLSQKVRNAEQSAIMSIGRGHVPLVRRGKYQMRVVARDENGNPVKLSSTYRSILPYQRAETREEAKEYAEGVKAGFDATANKWRMEDDLGNEVIVTLSATWSKAETTGGLTESVSVESFVNIANTIGINFSQDEMRKLVRALSAVEASIRKRVQRAGTPGFDPDAAKAIGEFIDRTASSNAKRKHGYKLPGYLNEDSLWNGDKAYLDLLQQRFDRAEAEGANEYGLLMAEQDLVRYATKYANSAAPEVGAETFTIRTRRGKREYKLLGEGNKHRENMKSLARYYRSLEDIDNPEDFLSTGVGSNLKVLTVASTLGGNVLNIASGLMNLTSLPMNTLPYYAYMNKTTGFGAGFGIRRAAAEMGKASANMANPKLAEIETWKDIVDNNKWKDNGLDDAQEALFMKEFTERGLGDAQMTNQFLGTQRNKTASVLVRKALDWWMYVFAQAEMFNRRVTGLMGYRMLRKRMIDGGKYAAGDFSDIHSPAFKELFEEIRTAVDSTQGQHSIWNRPAMFRGNFLGHIFLFKQFMVNSIQLIGRLPPQGQMAMLSMYLLAAGLKGLPFAEDIMDLLDLLLQKLGIRQASVELELTRALTEAFGPGVAQVAMYGVINTLTGATISSRVGLGDVIPFTGAFREGADIGREVENAIGPAFGTALGWGEWGAATLDGTAMVLGLKDATMGVDDWLRLSPVTAIRSATESAVFGLDGTVTDRRGRIVSEDVAASTVVGRMLGFYPYEATLANNIVRLGRIEDNYIKGIKADFVNAWARARRRGDTETMRRIERDVREWNSRARDAGDEQYEIKNFRRDALRSANEGDRPTIERYSRTGDRPERVTEDLVRAYGLE